jgi:hypothetical protein
LLVRVSIQELPELMVGRVLRALVWRFLLATRWQPDLLVQAAQFVIAVEQQLVVSVLLVRVWIQELLEPIVGWVVRSLVRRFLLVTRPEQSAVLVRNSRFLIAVEQQLVVSLLLVRVWIQELLEPIVGGLLHCLL